MTRCSCYTPRFFAECPAWPCLQGTYSPLVTKLREELSSERNQNEYMRNLVTNLEKDLEDVKQAKRDAYTELDAAKDMIVLLKSESRGLKR